MIFNITQVNITNNITPYNNSEFLYNMKYLYYVIVDLIKTIAYGIQIQS